MKNYAFSKAITVRLLKTYSCQRKIAYFMKVSFVSLSFFILSVQILLARNADAQSIYKTSVTVHLDKGPLTTVFKQIEKQTTFRFAYLGTQVNKYLNLTVLNGKNKLSDVLNDLFSQTQLDYIVKGNTIVVLERQTKSEITPVREPIRGSVKDVSGNALEGASVSIKGTSTGTYTNALGEYFIDAPLNSTLVFSFVGYITQEITITDNKPLNIILMLATTSTRDSVVVVGFGRQKKTTVVSSVSTVSGEDLEFGGRNLSTNLQGQVAGIISFQRSGQPGYDNATFWIRGISTYNGAQNPLILVDGVPRTFNDIDPNEIATFSVLKDAAATAVYGAEGANGVILVTTKRGTNQKTEITYRGEYSTLNPLRMPEFMGAAEYLSTYNEALRNEGKAPIFDQSLIDKYASGVDPDLYPNDDWLSILMRKHTYNTNHNLSFRGGTNKARYFVTGSYYNESGLFKSDAFSQYNTNVGLTRYNLRSNIDLDVTPTTLLRVDMSGQYLQTNYPSVNPGVDPGTALQDIFNLATTAPPYLYPAIYSDGTIADHPRRSYNRSNPYNLLYNSGYTNQFRTNIQTKVEINQKLDYFLKGLSARVDASYDYFGSYAVARGKSINSFYATGRDITGKLLYTQIQSGTDQITSAGTSLSGNKNIYLEGSLNYANIFSEKNDVTAMLLAYQKESQVSNDPLPFRKLGYVGRVTYAYDRRYSIEVNVGVTGSEAFAKGNRYGVFPAAGVAWIVSNEKFYPEALKDIVSSLKFRASYGLTGNDQYLVNGSPLRFLYRGGFTGAGGASLGYNSGGPLNSYPGYTEDRFSAPVLSWETEKKKNFGVDLGLLNNRLNIVFDYFDNYRYNILVQRQTVSAAAGFNQPPFQNFGKVTNKGYEASLNYRQPIGEHSAFSARGNFTYARNKIIEMDEVVPLYPWMASTGNRLNMNNVFVADRLFDDNDFNITTNPDGSKNYQLKSGIADQNYFGAVLPGDIKYKDLNEDGTINQFDQTKYVGNPTAPEITFGAGVSYEYKGFSLSLFFTGVGNTSVVLGADNEQGFFPFTYGVDESSVRTIVRDRWTEDNPSQNVLFPRIRASSFYNNAVPSTWWIRNAGFVRLKNAEFGYNLPKKILNKIKLTGLRAYVQGYNIITWDKIKYWDPEQGNGNAGVTYPQSRTFTFGIQASL